MKTPSVIDYVIGNAVACVALTGGALVMTYLWYVTGAPAVLAIFAAIVASYSCAANSRVQKYRAWKREWDLVNGVQTGTGGMNLPGMRPLAFVVIWLVAAIFITSHADEFGGPAALFWLSSIGAAIYGLYRYFRRFSPARPKAKTATVTVCLSVPRQCPNLIEASRAVPDYCLDLFPRRPR